MKKWQNEQNIGYEFLIVHIDYMCDTGQYQCYADYGLVSLKTNTNYILQLLFIIYWLSGFLIKR